MRWRALALEKRRTELKNFKLPPFRAPVPVRRSTLVCIVLAGVCVGTMFERYILVVEVPMEVPVP